MNLESKVSVIEAVLFASGEPISNEKLAAAAGVEKKLVSKLIGLLIERYESCKSALTVLSLDDSYQLTTRCEYAENIKAVIKSRKNTALTPAAMEVLTIIAYNQPVTKSFVEHVRGVESSSIVNSLVEKDLLEEAGRLDVPGRPIAYKTTNTFLRCFDMSIIEELPPLPSHSEQVSFNDVNEEDEENEEVLV